MMNNVPASRFSVVVPTRNAGALWEEWIVALKSTGILAEDVYIIDSESEDDTVRMSKDAGFNVKSIAKKEFDHGGTRDMALGLVDNYDYVIFLTQDAIIYSADSLENLLLPMKDPCISAVCGRQLPRDGAGVIEAHARLYNYAATSTIRRSEDIKRFGLKTAFISDSFAAYRLSVLKEIGGFPHSVIFGEDMYIATKMILAGYAISYRSDARVFHSHEYSFREEFKRYFDMGVFHAREPWIRQELGGAEGEGVKFVVSEFKYLLKNAFWRIPEGVVRTLFRYTGFRLGLVEKCLPQWLKRRLAMNKGYFKE